jgi:hypothetical protein
LAENVERHESVRFGLLAADVAPRNRHRLFQ